MAKKRSGADWSWPIRSSTQPSSAAYGWDPAISDEELLAALLALNLERAGQ